MKKILLLFVSLAMVVLAACGEEETESKDVDNANADTQEEKSDEPETETDEVDKVIVDDKNVKVKLTDVEYVKDDFAEQEYYEVNLDIKNERDEAIEVQAENIAIDGTMMDESLFSETVTSGNHSESAMGIDGSDGNLPDMDDNLEFTLDIFDEESLGDVLQKDVEIDF